ncbi:MAG: pilus assembly protein N-terminal domain-containing protein, partial [Planctomycetota bacterium]
MPRTEPLSAANAAWERGQSLIPSSLWPIPELKGSDPRKSIPPREAWNRLRLGAVFILAACGCLLEPSPVFADSRLIPDLQTPGGGAAGDQVSGGQGVEQRTLIKGTHQRILFPQNVERVAVGDESILGEVALTNREVLLFGKGVGRTSLIVWFFDGTFREYSYAVQVDLSLLQKALSEVHTSIRAEMAPDRDAIVLRGLVP